MLTVSSFINWIILVQGFSIIIHCIFVFVYIWVLKFFLSFLFDSVILYLVAVVLFYDLVSNQFFFIYDFIILYLIAVVTVVYYDLAHNQIVKTILWSNHSWPSLIFKEIPWFYHCLPGRCCCGEGHAVNTGETLKAIWWWWCSLLVLML